VATNSTALVRLVIALSLGALAAPPTAKAASGARTPRVGIFQVNGPAAGAHFVEAFKAGMRERGYTEGRNVVFEPRFGDGNRERIAEAAAELVRLRVDVIVTATDQGVAAVKQQTQTIPIVMANSTDPVGTGFVRSLAHPGGNITGHSSMSPELSGKRLELLKELLPSVSRVAILWSPDVRGAVLDYKETETAARSLRLQLQSVEIARADDLDRAFSTMAAGRAEALIVPAPNPVAFASRSRIVALAQKHRLPTIYGVRDFADAGGLMTYGPNPADMWQRAAAYVDKILKGARPGDLPVEQPSTFELVVNTKAARAIGLTVPAGVLGRTNRIVE
jgi:putative ABC transport system substrate-binding protein